MDVTEPDNSTAAPIPHWRRLGNAVSAWFDAPSMTVGAELIASIARLPGGTPLDLDLRPGGVRVSIDSAAETADVTHAISAAARQLGMTANSAALQSIRLSVDSVDPGAIAPFWQTVFDFEPGDDTGLVDPLRRDPGINFHSIEEARPLRNRIHIDVVRSPDAVTAARESIGSAVFGAYELTLADSDGNEIDVVPGDNLSESSETEDWQAVFAAMVFYPTPSLQLASQLATAVAALADAADVPLLVDVRPVGVTIDSGKDLWEDDGHGSAERFANLARQIQIAARDLGLVADPTCPRFVQLAIDAVDVPAVQAFWVEVLGYQSDPRSAVTDIFDPRRLNPVIMFQSMDQLDTERRQQRNRIRLELLVPRDHAKSRIDMALSAGGRLVSEDQVAGRYAIVDPEGNELDIVTGS